MMQHGRSGTGSHGPSGTRSSDYREPVSALNMQKRCGFTPFNLANQESSGFLLTRDRMLTGGKTATPRPAETGVGNNPALTHVTLIWREGICEDWLKFGKPVATRIIDRRQRIESYAAGKLFGLMRWAANDYGTIRSTLDIVRAVGAGEVCTPIAQVDPGGELLLSVRGWPKVAAVFRLIDTIDALGIDPCDVAPDYWQHIHNRLCGREAPRSYSAARHRAWLQRKALLT